MCNSIDLVQANDPSCCRPAVVDVLCRLQAGQWIIFAAWFGIWVHHMLVMPFMSFVEELVHYEEVLVAICFHLQEYPHGLFGET
jgi:hypothetical protein